MPRTNETTVQRDKQGRYNSPVPKAFGDALNLEGKKLVWKQVSGTAFRVEVKEDEN